MTRHHTSTGTLFFLAVVLIATPHVSTHAFAQPKMYIPLAEMGTSIACSIGAAAGFIAAAYICATYKQTPEETKKSGYTSHLPPREFLWCMSMIAACIMLSFASDKNYIRIFNNTDF